MCIISFCDNYFYCVLLFNKKCPLLWRSLAPPVIAVSLRVVRFCYHEGPREVKISLQTYKLRMLVPWVDNVSFPEFQKEERMLAASLDQGVQIFYPLIK